MKTLIVSLIFLTSIQAQAINVRVIGSGGAGPEMVALTRFSSLVEYLPFCLSAANPCELNSEQLKMLAQVQDQQLKLSKKPHLIFHEEVEPKIIVDQNDGSISISTSVVYSDDTGANASEWMFIGYLNYLTNTDLSGSRDWLNLSQSLFKELNWTKSELKLFSPTRTIKFYQMNGRVNQAFLWSIDAEDNVEDLTKALESHLSCSSGAQLLAFTQFPIHEGSGFSVEVEWICEGSRYRGVAFGNTNENTDWTFNVFSVQEVFQYALCTKLLKGSKSL